MITIRELFGVTHTISRLDVMVYDTSRPGWDKLAGHWLIGWPDGWRFPRSLQYDVDSGAVEAYPIKVNARDYPGSEGRWGLQPGVLPGALLDAPVCSLLMRCKDGVSYEIDVNIEMATLTAEACAAKMRARCGADE